jgi:hypothetical protein
MFRLFLVLGVLAAGVVGVACTPTACMDLCDTQMPCGSPYTCVSSRCVISHGDAGPPNCMQ